MLQHIDIQPWSGWIALNCKSFELKSPSVHWYSEEEPSMAICFLASAAGFGVRTGALFAEEAGVWLIRSFVQAACRPVAMVSQQSTLTNMVPGLKWQEGIQDFKTLKDSCILQGVVNSVLSAKSWLWALSNHPTTFTTWVPATRPGR